MIGRLAALIVLAGDCFAMGAVTYRRVATR